MFCKNCGNKIEKNEKFCGSCGEVNTEMQELSGETTASTMKPVTDKSKGANNKKIGLIASLILLVVVGVTGALFFSSGSGSEQVLERYVNAIIASDFRQIDRYSVLNLDAFISEIRESQGLTEREFRDQLYEMTGMGSIQDLFDDISEEININLERQFGSDFEIIVEIMDTFPVTRRERESQINSIERLFEQMGIDGNRVINFAEITEMVEYEVDLLITGSRGEQVDTVNFYMVRIGRNWRVLDADFVGQLRNLLR